jgi:hypothetical protein
MKIQYDKDKINNFHEVIKQHDFTSFLGLTNKYKLFEDPNLSPEMVLVLLEQLNPSNSGKILTFNDFWKWYKDNLGKKTVELLAQHMYPSKSKKYELVISTMMKNQDDELWEHLRARVYKKWCSIMTETQCVYSMLEYIEENNKKWEIVSSPKLDSKGVDFIIVAKTAVPIQVKMLTRSRIAAGKKNNLPNLSLEELKKGKLELVSKELKNIGYSEELEIGKSILVQYGLKDRDGTFPFDYLKQHDNGFIYFDANILMKQLSEHIENKQPKKLRI